MRRASSCPLVLGILTSHFLPKVAEALKKPLQWLSIVIFVAMVVLSFSSNIDAFLVSVKYIFIVVLIHNFLALTIGFTVGTIGKVPFRDRRTLTIETGIMVAAGYSLCRLSTSYYRELIEKYRILSDNKRQMNAQMAILESMSEIYEYASLIDLDAMTETAIRDTGAADRHASGKLEGQSRVNAALMPSIAPECREAFEAFADLSDALTRLHDQQSMDREFRSAQKGWFRAQYIVVERRPDGTPRRIIYTIQNIDRQKRKEEQLIRISMTDELTGLSNRRGYDTDMAAYHDRAMEPDFVIFSVDVNGLKEANDTKGHVAGDELLMATAECLTTVIGPIGKVYRTGGDEFLATAMTDAPSEVLEQIRSRSAEWRGAYGETLSLSVGYAAHSEHPDADIHGLEIQADQMMYRAKSRYYNAPGTDRRRHLPESE